MARQVQYNDLTIDVPDDATDAEVAAIIETKEQESRVKPYQPGPLERAGRYLADYGQGIRDAATQPLAKGPTELPLVDAAAGVADFGATALTDMVTAPLRAGSYVFRKARGGQPDYNEISDTFARKPATPVGQAIQDTLGATLRPAGDALTAAGVDPNTAAFGMDVAGTAADAIGMGWAARGAKAGLRSVRPDMPDPGVNPRPFGPSVERARRLDFRVLPSQVAAKSQLELAPLGRIGPPVPGTFFGQSFTGPEFMTRFLIDNQKRVNNFTAKELGISAVTPQGLQLAKNPHLAVYNEVVQALPYVKADWELGNAANEIGAARRNNTLLKNTSAVDEVRDRLLSFESAPTQKVLDAIREFRQTANKYYRQADASTGTGSEVADQAGDAYRAAADALEQAIERQTSALNPDLVPRLQAARTQLAKIHNVEDAFDGVNVDPQMLATLGKRFPLSGYLQELADIARDFPDTMQVATGLNLPIQSQQGVINSLRLAAQRFAGRTTQTPRLMSDEFQNRYGIADPDYDPRPAPPAPAAAPIVDYTPPDPNLPGGADVGPPTQGGGGGLAAVGLADDFDTLPPAEVRQGDLTAETPPMGGSLPAGLTDDLAAALTAALTDLGLEPPLPPRGPDSIDFAADPELARLLVGDDPLGQQVPQAPGGDALDINRAVTPPLTDTELLDIQLQTALPPGPDPRLGDVRGRPLPPDDDLAAGLVPVEPPGPRGGPDAGGAGLDDLTVAPTPERAAAPELDAEINLADYPAPPPLPGEAKSVKLYRGENDANRGGSSTSRSKSYSDDPKVASRYGNVSEETVEFKNVLAGGTYAETAAKLGLPAKATQRQLVQRAREMGYDGLEYVIPGGEREFVKLTRE